MRVDIYSHNFAVTEFNFKDKEVLFEFLSLHLVQYELIRVDGRFIKKKLRSFAAANKARTAFRFHLNSLKDFKEFIYQRGYDWNKLNVVTHPVVEGEVVNFKLVDTREPRDYQERCINYMVVPNSFPEYANNRIAVLQTGRGKAQCLNAKIRIPGGWRRMGDIKVNDEVIAPDGSTTYVTGVFPQGVKRLYRVEFGDGRSTVACAEHLWKVYSADKCWKLVNTLELLRLISTSNHAVYISLIEPEIVKDVELLTQPDELGSALRKRNNEACQNTFIPDEYLEASHGQKAKLLKGLFYAAAYCGSSKLIVYETKSLRLAEGVQYLIRSMGGTASLSVTVDYETTYCLHIYYKDLTEIFSDDINGSQHLSEIRCFQPIGLSVKSVTPIGEGEAQCISVAHPEHLYVTDDFIVTHNTMISLRAVGELDRRTVCIIKGMYVEKWIEDFIGSYGKRKGDLMVVRGSKDLKNLMALALDGELRAKFIIITNTTMYNYLSQWETFNGITDYDVDPIDFFPTLKAGVRLIDEVHQDFHLNFRLDLYTHIEQTINLSATMDPDDEFIKKMYELMFPPPTRFAGVEYKRYINVKALRYQLNEPRRVKCKQYGRNSYSHVMYEHWIIKNPKVLQNYMRLIANVVETSFIKVMQPGQKMLIFAATVEMCGIITTYLNDMYRKHNLKIRRYTGVDPFEYLMESDISVSTIKSAGTAVDIPGLRVTLMTDAMNSRQANDQALGRLRELHQWPNVNPEFIYFICMDIDKHNQYHQRKVENFKGKVLTHQALNTGFRI